MDDPIPDAPGRPSRSRTPSASARPATPSPGGGMLGPATAVVLVVLAVLLGVFSSAGGDADFSKPTGDETDAAGATTTTKPAAQAFTMSFVGDMMLGTNAPTPDLPPNNAKDVFAPVKPLLTGDLIAGSLLGPLADQGPVPKCPSGKPTCALYSQPPAFAGVYKDAGFGLLDLGNSHIIDRGVEGIKQTTQVLDAAGIKYVGLTPVAAEFELGGNKTQVLGFSPFVNTNAGKDLTAVADQVRVAKSRSNIVIVMFSGGNDVTARIPKSGDSGFDVVKFAHTAVDAGADLVIGTGPHVLRAMEFYKDHLIAYSLGNFVLYGKASVKGPTAQSAVLGVSLNPDGTFAGGQIRSVQLNANGLPSPAGNTAAAAKVAELSKADFPQTAIQIGADGTILKPTPGGTATTAPGTTKPAG